MKIKKNRTKIVKMFATAASLGVALSCAAETAVTFYADDIVRIERFPGEALADPGSLAVVMRPVDVAVVRTDSLDGTEWRTRSMIVRQDAATGRFAFFAADGSALLKETANGFSRRTGGVDADAYEVSTVFSLEEGEAVYGLGILQDGKLSKRGTKCRMIQDNCEDFVPFVQSVKGWGLFWDNPSPTDFEDGAGGMAFKSDVGDRIVYYFMNGGSVDGVVACMRRLTGHVPMMPKWTFGYWISKERYKSFDEDLAVLREHRRRGIPLDVVVQDWQYWGGNYLWNAMEFLMPGFRDAKKNIKAIHDEHAKFMVSVWASFGPATKPYRELSGKGLLIDFTTWPVSGIETEWPPRKDYPSGVLPYDPYSGVARDIYWQNMKRLWDCGVDGWWMDSTEPDHHEVKDADFEQMTAMGSFRKVRNAFPLMTVEGVYRHQRADPANTARVAIMTRSAWAGQQRTGANTWSGDTKSSWETLRRQIPAALGFGMCGNPNFNTDIGGFFCSAYNSQGKESAPRNPQFQELNARWMQFGAFNPIFRSHGTDAPREIWRFGDRGDAPYEAMEATVRLRYALLPYIYSIAHRVTKDDATFMRPLVADFKDDRRTWELADEFMFGDSLLVAPVVHAQYFPEKISKSVEPVDFTKPMPTKTYLPAGARWYDFWTGERFDGGRDVAGLHALRTFPLYVREGAIIPIGPDIQWTDEATDGALEIRVYPGADGAFTLYDDAGDGYQYEKGEFCEIPFAWNDAARRLTIGERIGSYPGMAELRRFTIVLPDGSAEKLDYDGSEISCTIPKCGNE